MCVGGLGDGTFVVLLTFGFSVALALLGGFMRPQQGALIAILCALLPLIVFGLIAASPLKGEYADVVIDKLYPVRIIVVLVLALCSIVSLLGNSVVTALLSPKYSAPRSTCRRKILKANHPAWVQ
jgi:hypothetical protein